MYEDGGCVAIMPRVTVVLESQTVGKVVEKWLSNLTQWWESDCFTLHVVLSCLRVNA